MGKKTNERMMYTGIDESLGVQCSNGPMEIEISLIQPFKNHPFKVLDDAKMDELEESIIKQGILSPVLVRPGKNGTYEMISGHRRLHAAKRAEFQTVPAIVLDLNDDEATIVMIDSNLQREEILPSERAFAFKMKMDALRHQGTCRHDVAKLSPIERKSTTVIGAGSGLTGRSVERYIKLTDLIPELLEMVDNKIISLVMGVDIASFEIEVQRYLLQYIKEKGRILPGQIAVLKKQTNLENLTPYTVMTLMKQAAAEKDSPKRITFTEKKLDKYFPRDYPPQKRSRIICELLEKWKEENFPNGMESEG